MSHDDFLFVDDLCKKLGIGWFASVLDYPSYLFIKQFDPEMVKLPSTISEHTEFLEAVAKDFKKDVVISTGTPTPIMRNLFSVPSRMCEMSIFFNVLQLIQQRIKLLRLV
ncbi:N-acetylneuraminate synthase family protein [Cobetia marina]